MINDLNPAIAALLAAAATLVVMMVVMQRRVAALQDRLALAQSQHHADLDNARSAADAKVAEHRTACEAEFKAKLEEARAHQLSVVVHPFVRTRKNDGWLTKESTADVGYKYQLMLQGIPCFAAHDVVVESSVHKEMNHETIAFLQQKAEQLANIAFAAKGGVLASTVSMGKTAISSAQTKAGSKPA